MTDHTDQYPPHSGPDTVPAFRGLILGAIVLAIILVTIVRLTNAHYRHAESTTPAEATK
jgi:hypothetical protein